MRPMQDTQHTTTDDYDPRYDSQLVPGLSFNGTLVKIGRLLRKLFGRPTPTR